VKAAREFVQEFRYARRDIDVADIEQRDREVRAAALREAADWFAAVGGWPPYSTTGVVERLRGMAERGGGGE